MKCPRPNGQQIPTSQAPRKMVLRWSLGSWGFVGHWAFGILIFFIPCTALADAPSQPPTGISDIGIDQNLGQQVPPDLMFKDENGHDVRLGQYFHGKPVILTLVYYECPMLCTMVLNDLVRSLNMVSLEPGRDFEIVTVSFNPKDTPELAYKKKRSYLSAYERDGAEAGWHFLTGQQAEITALTKAVGFRYHWDPIHEVFAHASGIMILTPDGKLSRYFFGIDYVPVDLKLSLVEASDDTIGSKTDQILLYCCAYDPATGRYGILITKVLKLLGVVTILVMASLIGVLTLRNRWKGHVEAPA
jgi:protein SCO1